MKSSSKSPVYAAFAVGAFAVACSSSSGSGASTADGGAGNDAAVGGDASAGDTGTTTGDTGGGTGAYCQLVTAYTTACDENDACDQAVVADCEAYGMNFSAAALSADYTCITAPYMCSDAGSLAIDACIIEQLSMAVPTAAQQKAKTDFCAVCPDGASAYAPTSCSGFFEFDDDGGREGVGYGVLVVSDALATQMDQMCVAPPSGDGGAAGDCAIHFVECATAVDRSTTPSGCMGEAGANGRVAMPIHPRP